MNITEHLLTVAAEECAEIAQAIAKALRFGLDDAHPKNGNLGNRELIAREYEDLLGVMDMLQKRGILRPPTHLAITAKKARVHQYHYAAKTGALDPSDSSTNSAPPDLTGMRVDEFLRYTAGLHPKWDCERAEQLRQQFALASTARVRTLSQAQLAKLTLLVALASGHKPKTNPTK